MNYITLPGARTIIKIEYPLLLESLILRYDYIKRENKSVARKLFHFLFCL